MLGEIELFDMIGLARDGVAANRGRIPEMVLLDYSNSEVNYDDEDIDAFVRSLNRSVQVLGDRGPRIARVVGSDSMYNFSAKVDERYGISSDRTHTTTSIDDACRWLDITPHLLDSANSNQVSRWISRNGTAPMPQELSPAKVEVLETQSILHELRSIKELVSQNSHAAEHRDSMIDMFGQRYGLSPREQQLIRKFVEIGRADPKAVSQELEISLYTTRNHLKSIYKKTDTASLSDCMVKILTTVEAG